MYDLKWNPEYVDLQQMYVKSYPETQGQGVGDFQGLPDETRITAYVTVLLILEYLRSF